MNPKAKENKFGTISEGLDCIEVVAVYNMLDIEATRRELKAARKSK